MLTFSEIQFVLSMLSSRYGHGYSDKPGIGALQAKLSIMCELCANRGDRGGDEIEDETAAIQSERYTAQKGA